MASGSSEPREPLSAQPCGGRLKGPAGIIQTPNFPNPFPVPIKCRWIIDNDLVNGTISIYFTQQYTTSGLTFTEYMYYDDTYKLGERRALTLTDDNIARIKWLQVTSPVLVVELSLARLEGTQLRALGLLQVFGFNVTYAVRRAARAAPRSCSALECRLLGHCLATSDYQEFYCACFAGYSGADCGVGPLCLASPRVCQNGGTCRQLGAAAVSCVCAPGYTGDLCEASLAPPRCSVECEEGCAGATSCDCNPKESDASAARFETRLLAADEGNASVAEELAEQVKIYLKNANVSLEDDVTVFDVRASETLGVRSYGVRVWAARGEAGALRAALAQLVAARSLSRLRLKPAALQLDAQPALNLHALVVNQQEEVWEGAEFILSCVAYGPRDTAFTWYKDGVEINLNATTRDMWTRLVVEEALERRMSVLGVEAARAQDAGRWACVAQAAGRRRCRALRLAVRAAPAVTLLPHASLTVNKGDNVTLTCLAGGGRGAGALGFSWARDRTLLPLHTRHHVWEDLYPAGSLLKLYNVQKSGEYRCSATSSAGSAARSVRLWALAAGAVACGADGERGLRWPRTAPGARASAPCPPAYSGEVVRYCEPETEQHGVKWKQPDFSGCVADALKDIYENFTRISLGFSWQQVSDVVKHYWRALRALPPLPGHGAPPLQHCSAMLRYLQSAAVTVTDRERGADYLLRIFDSLLEHPDSFMDEQNIYDLQDAVANTGAMKGNADVTLTQLSITTKATRKDGAAHFTFQPPSARHEAWVVTSAGIELPEEAGNATAVVVQYHNLEERLPSLRRFTEFKSGVELQYHVVSWQVQVWSRSAGAAAAPPRAITALFTRTDNHSAGAVACALRTAAEPQRWRVSLCEAAVFTHPQSQVACRCTHTGTLALVAAGGPTLANEENNLRDVINISFWLSIALCIVSGSMQLASLCGGGARGGAGGVEQASGDWLGAILRVTVCAAHAVATLGLLHIDSSDAVGDGGSAVGWVVAAGWVCSLGALCAQPLLLQAELARAARPSAAPAMLAGVCVLSVLTARLAGGAPLVGDGAARTVLCAAGGTLAALCGVGAAVVAAKLSAALRKLPHERNQHWRERCAAVRHTLVVLATSLAWQACGALYAQRSRSQAHAAAAAAIINGTALLACYVVLDAGVRRAARSLLPTARRLPLHLQQPAEAESRSGAAMLPAAPPGYWRAPRSEVSLHRRQSSPDSRADVVRCVERLPLCDLVSHTHAHTQHTHPPNTPIVCLPLVTLDDQHTPEPLTPPFTCSVHYDPYFQLRYNPLKQSCNICVQSNPDVSTIPSPPAKSCLKKPTVQFASSLPSVKVNKPTSKSDIEQVNREWNRAYECPNTEIVFHKITNDLDFLLNRTVETNLALEQIKEAPS